MDLLILGSGGRESALEWKLNQSSFVNKIYVCPGNGGTTNNLNLSLNDLNEIKNFAKKNNLVTIVGPEVPLNNGIVNMFKEEKLKIFGPSKEAAQLETSKIFAKNFMKNANISTANFEIFSDYYDAVDYVKKHDGKVVIKADGLAAGKGVSILDNVQDSVNYLNQLMIKKTLGDAGNNVIIEQILKGEEISVFYLSDGNSVIRLSTAQDHKRIFDNDTGPNTGGMGSYSPCFFLSDSILEDIDKIAKNTILNMKLSNKPFCGILYIGVIISNDKPYVLEYNVRFGDPEAQVLLPRMKSDLYPYIEASINQELDKMPELIWSNQFALCVILSSLGYPNKYPVNEKISGVNQILKMQNIYVFHSGTKIEKNILLTNGGRVLGITSLNKNLNNAIKHAYNAVNLIKWDNIYFRNDIGNKALKYL
jgi:phosphoribosylamine--glycine ligase